ncbi:hypothetical protein HDU93_009726 [Gonapodya sp. JEL0774]|nr:hypothetical protein HDU93_009726 [Gonapodya sp. JEL0774]
MAFELVRSLWGKSVERDTAGLVGGAGWKPAGWNEDEFGKGVGGAGLYTYLSSSLLRLAAPYILPSVIDEARRKRPSKRTVYVVVVEGWTDALSLGRGVECFGAPACVSDLTFHFVHIYPPTVLPTPAQSPILARTAADIILECDVQIPRGHPASSCIPVLPSDRDIFFVPEFLLPKASAADVSDAIKELRTTLKSAVDLAGTVVVCGSEAAVAVGAPREEVAMAQAAGWARAGKWVVCGTAVSVAGAVVDVIGEMFGEGRRKEVVEFCELREGVAAYGWFNAMMKLQMPSSFLSLRPSRFAAMDGHLIFVASEIVLLCVFLFVMLFGPSPKFKDTFVARVYDFLTQGMWRMGFNALRSVCGVRAANSAYRLVHCLTSEAHPLIQIFYFTILSAGVLVFLVYGYPRLPTPLLGPIQTYVTIPLTIFSAYASFYLASVSDPGKVTSKNVAKCLEVFEFDYVLYTPRTCSTCLFVNIALCAELASRKTTTIVLGSTIVVILLSLYGSASTRIHDNLASCASLVGHNNHRYFLAYLVCTAFITVYGSYVVFEILRGEVLRRRIWEMWVRDAPGGAPRKVGWYDVGMIMSRDESILVALLVFIALAFILAAVFGTYQFYLVLMGITTNETSKWEDLHHLIKEQGYVDITRPKIRDPAAPPAPSKTNPSQIRSPSPTKIRHRRPPRVSTPVPTVAVPPSTPSGAHSADVPKSPPTPSVHDEAIDDVDGEWETVRVTNWDDLDNVYDKGVLWNLQGTLFPTPIN